MAPRTDERAVSFYHAWSKVFDRLECCVTANPELSRKSETPEPQKEPAAKLTGRVTAVLDRIRPAIQADGGDIEFVDITEAQVVRIRLHGACVGCPSSTMTLRQGIERNLRANVPEIAGVEALA